MKFYIIISNKAFAKIQGFGIIGFKKKFGNHPELER